MTNDELVSIEVAKLAKELKFDWRCPNFYTFYGELSSSVFLKSNLGDQHYRCPTQTALSRWLREKHGIHIQIGTDYSGSLCYECMVGEWQNRAITRSYYYTEINMGNHFFKTFEECTEAAILKSLEYLKEKQ